MSLLAELSARVRLDTDFAVYRKKSRLPLALISPGDA